MKKNVKLVKYALMGIISMGIVSTTLTSCKDYDDDIDRIDGELGGKATTDQVNTLKATVDAQSEKISAIESQIAALQKGGESVSKADLDAVIADLNAEKGKLEALTTKMSTDFAAIETAYKAGDTALSQQIASFKEAYDTKVKAIDDALIAQGGRIDAIDSSLNTITDAITAINARLDALEDAIANMLRSIEPLNWYHTGEADDDGMVVFYGKVASQVSWDGHKGNMAAGVWSTLDRDPKVLLNPSSADATLYEYSFVNTVGQAFPGIPFGTPEVISKAFTTATRAAAAPTGAWQLVKDFGLDPTHKILPTFISYTESEGSKIVYALQAKRGADVVKSAFEYMFTVKDFNRSVKFTGIDYPIDGNTFIVGQEYKPSFNFEEAGDTAVIWDYKLSVASAEYDIQRFGLKVSDDKYSFMATNPQAVGNKAKFNVEFLLINGQKANGSFEVIFNTPAPNVDVDVNFDESKLHEPFNAKFIEVDSLGNDVWGMARELSLQPVIDAFNGDQAAITNYKAACASTGDRGGAEVKYTLNGGDNVSVEEYDKLQELLANRIKIDITAGDKAKITFLAVENDDIDDLTKVIPLNRELKITAVLTRSGSNKVATFRFCFNLKQPTAPVIDNRTYGMAQWNGNALNLYGQLAAPIAGQADSTANVYGDLREAFDAYTTAAPNYSVFKHEADYYTLLYKTDDKATIATTNKSNSTTTTTETPVALSGTNTIGTAIPNSSNAADWMTFTTAKEVADGTSFSVVRTYTFYGVYPATANQLSSPISVKLASLVAESKTAKYTGAETVLPDSRSIFLTDEDFELATGLDKKYYMFNGVSSLDETGKASTAYTRPMLNAQAFQEGVNGFAKSWVVDNTTFKAAATNMTLTTANIAWDDTTMVTYDVNGNPTVKLPLEAATPNVVNIVKVPATDGALAITGATPEGAKKAFNGGIIIQLPSNVAVGPSNKVNLTLTLTDVFGAKKEIGFSLYIPN